MQIVVYVLACRSYSLVLYITASHYHHSANLSEDIELIKCLSDIFFECVSKILYILPVTQYTIYGAVCFQFSYLNIWTFCATWNIIFSKNYTACTVRKNVYFLFNVYCRYYIFKTMRVQYTPPLSPNRMRYEVSSVRWKFDLGPVFLLFWLISFFYTYQKKSADIVIWKAILSQ